MRSRSRLLFNEKCALRLKSKNSTIEELKRKQIEDVYRELTNPYLARVNIKRMQDKGLLAEIIQPLED